MVVRRVCENEGCQLLLPASAPTRRRFCSHKCQNQHWRDTGAPSNRRSLEEVIAGYVELAAKGATRAEAAAALGITYAALGQAIKRARDNGDSRVGTSSRRSGSSR